MDECSYMHPWPYLYTNRRYDNFEATYWIEFTTTQFMPCVVVTENIKIQ